jgi:hypothetical protein
VPEEINREDSEYNNTFAIPLGNRDGEESDEIKGEKGGRNEAEHEINKKNGEPDNNFLNPLENEDEVRSQSISRPQYQNSRVEPFQGVSKEAKERKRERQAHAQAQAQEEARRDKKKGKKKKRREKESVRLAYSRGGYNAKSLQLKSSRLEINVLEHSPELDGKEPKDRSTIGHESCTPDLSLEVEGNGNKFSSTNCGSDIFLKSRSSSWLGSWLASTIILSTAFLVSSRQWTMVS